MKKIQKPIQVGIFDSTLVARCYRDKIIITEPYVRWVGNTGGYAVRKHRIDDPAQVAAFRADGEAALEAWLADSIFG